jgi:hypothetical protein
VYFHLGHGPFHLRALGSIKPLNRRHAEVLDMNGGRVKASLRDSVDDERRRRGRVSKESKCGGQSKLCSSA